MAEKKNKGLGIPETKGQFQIRGIVTGTKKETFYTEKQTKTNKPFRAVNFGVEVANGSTMYVGFNGMEQESVYFNRPADKAKGETKGTTKAVPWKDRFKFSETGFRMIGVNVGVTKTKDEKGNDVNNKKTLHQYDACKEIGDNLSDGASVFIRGNITHSKYKDKHQTRFEPSQVSLCKPIEFDDEDFKEMADFQQTIVFMGIEKDKNADGRSIVSAKIVTYNSVEDAEFIITNQAIATNFRKNLKPYCSINVWGKINVVKNTEPIEMDSDDCWGEENEMAKVNAPTIRELLITGADPKTIEKETYSEENIDAAIAKMNSEKTADKDYGESGGDNWGSVGSTLDDDGDVPW